MNIYMCFFCVAKTFWHLYSLKRWRRKNNGQILQGQKQLAPATALLNSWWPWGPDFIDGILTKERERTIRAHRLFTRLLNSNLDVKLAAMQRRHQRHIRMSTKLKKSQGWMERTFSFRFSSVCLFFLFTRINSKSYLSLKLRQRCSLIHWNWLLARVFLWLTRPNYPCNDITQGGKGISPCLTHTHT